MPKGVTKTRPKTVAALLDAALELFAEQGFGATSIPEICARAGLTKGAFYSNFADKEALFLALFDRYAAARLQRVRDGLALRKAQAESAQTVAAPGAPDAEDRRWFLISMEFTLHAIRHPEVAALLAAHEARTRAAAAEVVIQLLESRGRVPSIAIQDLVAMLVAAHEGSIAQELTRQAAGGAEAEGSAGSRMISALLQQLTAPISPTAGQSAAPDASPRTDHS